MQTTALTKISVKEVKEIDELFENIHGVENEVEAHLKSFSRDIRDYLRKNGNSNRFSKNDINIKKLEIYAKRTLHFFEIMPDNNSLVILYPESAKIFDELFCVAKALAYIALRYDKATDGRVSFDGYTFFACKMLKHYCSLENGAFSRRILTETIKQELNKINVNLDEKEIRNIEKIFNNIFPEDPKTKILRCEIRLIKKYIKREFHPDEEFEITTKEESSALFTDYKKGPRALLRPSARNCGAEILYSGASYFEHKDCDIRYKDKGLSVSRALIAHELAHHVCHSLEDDERRNNDPTLEPESTRFARLILEHRELLYVGGDKENKDYKEACQYWHTLLIDLHPIERNNPNWIKFVFD
ncbi:MAG: hypothetical protein FWG45_05375 [Oscillospiraceae bacterium]|nr:hypothetical protein [Oscillospiraceae bacterium]